ncbi:glutaredoxin domain-containing protein [Ditylenchus destructor]|uniref:Glutaredoxin-related protein 5, mitochondrial n=1 Tax=Ditylenchus destructor TaxID=166010 RepID=A0AAD4RB40_9BILA|nr:glutaredoxin domain-containing protein [Ditylenchus destructor]
MFIKSVFPILYVSRKVGVRKWQQNAFSVSATLGTKNVSDINCGRINVRIPERFTSSLLFVNKRTSINNHQQHEFSTSAAFQADNPPDITRDRIDAYVKKDKVVVFMKGRRDNPMCGFSRNVVMVLQHYGISFKEYNVLDDDDIRQGIKEYSDWPTIPQVFVNGEFIGGSDVLVKMHNDDEINKFFGDQGIKTKFSDDASQQDEK